ncbi:MAG TPA: hypothetical protein VKB93_16320 [Thermoanaerobaculia bacterium]|nr:hypothetical protein [Thermoanaerobaculia bacterium]
MRKLVFLLAVLCCLFLATSLSAQATGTWVSGVGDDVNPCSRTAPCKTFAGAISKTATCGEIRVLDPGGFGTITITKSITIDGTGTLASILNGGSAISGVLVNLTNPAETGGCFTVIIRNITINGTSTSVIGGNGVRDVSTVAHSLHLEHVSIQHENRGVSIATNAANTKVFMKDVDIRHTTIHGIDVAPTAGQQVRLNLHDVRSRQSAGDGLRLANNVQGTVNSSQFEGNNNGINVVANSVTMMLRDSVMSNNALSGLINGSTATTLLDGVTINGNGTGILNNSGGSLFGYGNNAVGFNGTDVNGGAITSLPHP